MAAVINNFADSSFASSQKGKSYFQQARYYEKLCPSSLLPQRYYEKAAEAGYIPAIIFISGRYYQGCCFMVDSDNVFSSVYQDKAKAFEVIRSAVASSIEETDATILFLLSRFYLEGIGCERKESYAEYFLRNAIKEKEVEYFTIDEIQVFGNVSHDIRSLAKKISQSKMR